MYETDYIMRQIDLLSRGLAKVLFNRDMETEEEIVDEQGGFSESGLLLHMVKKLLLEKKINEAENLLFETIEEDPQEDYLKTALYFYERLDNMSDEELAAVDFSREEIADGLREIQRLYELPGQAVWETEPDEQGSNDEPESGKG